MASFQLVFIGFVAYGANHVFIRGNRNVLVVLAVLLEHRFLDFLAGTSQSTAIDTHEPEVVEDCIPQFVALGRSVLVPLQEVALPSLLARGSYNVQQSSIFLF